MFFKKHTLLNTLKKEILYEKSLDRKLVFLSEFLRKHDYIQQVSENLRTIKLYKLALPYRLQIEFFTRFPKKTLKHEELEQKEEEEEVSNVDTNTEDDCSNFYVSIQKELSQNFHLECFTINSKIWIQNLTFTDNMPESVPSIFNRNGPFVSFPVLNEGLQNLMVDWLKSIGISDDLGKFIEIMSLSGERELYKNWLSKTYNLIENL